MIFIKSREYHNIHYWLRNTFGNAYKCESNICQKKSKSYHYALKREFKHTRDRKSYFMLCQSCHAFYDMINNRKGRTSDFNKGENHNQSILTEKDVLEIRRDYIPRKISAPMLGKKYGVTPSCIDRIIKRKNWKHI